MKDGLHVAVVGSRGFHRLDCVVEFVKSLPDGATVVSGHAPGVDLVAEKAAKARGLNGLIFPANWKEFGKRAGFIRNRDIVQHADVVVAFWDGESRGTQNTIDYARGEAIPVFVFNEAEAHMAVWPDMLPVVEDYNDWLASQPDGEAFNATS